MKDLFFQFNRKVVYFSAINSGNAEKLRVSQTTFCSKFEIISRHFFNQIS